MAKCPNCGANVETPVKTWSLSQKTQKPGEQAKVSFGMFECSSCRTRFRATVEEPKEATSIKSMAKEIKVVEGELVNTLKNLHEKIQKLETERANLLLEIEELKKAAESKATALENEIVMLRDEVKSLKDLLGYTETEEEPPHKKR
jgi:chromosome segregation ATPase